MHLVGTTPPRMNHNSYSEFPAALGSPLAEGDNPNPHPRIDTLTTISILIERDREPILTAWRKQVRRLPSAAHLDTPTLNDHVPSLLVEMAAALRADSKETIAENLRDGSPPVHGLQRVADGYDIEEVVAEYNILRACIHDAADAAGLNLQGAPFRLINAVMDAAIGMAVKTFAEQRALEVQRRREEYLAFVAHDMRTPLAAAALAVRLIETSSAPGAVDHRAQLLRTVKRNVQHMSTLVTKVLEENANLQTELGTKLERRTFELWPLVEGLTHDLHPVAQTGSTRIINAVPDDLLVYADADLLRRVFQNLIANAIKYTPSGEVTIGAERQPPAERQPQQGDSGGVTCWVKDNGAGIPAALVHSVFDKGETDPKSDGGLGLGLSIVKTLIEAHGGHVVVSSIEGQGALFRFDLPARSPTPPLTPSPPRQEHRGS